MNTHPINQNVGAQSSTTERPSSSSAAAALTAAQPQTVSMGGGLLTDLLESLPPARAIDVRPAQVGKEGGSYNLQDYFAYLDRQGFVHEYDKGNGDISLSLIIPINEMGRAVYKMNIDPLVEGAGNLIRRLGFAWATMGFKVKSIDKGAPQAADSISWVLHDHVGSITKKNYSADILPDLPRREDVSAAVSSAKFRGIVSRLLNMPADPRALYVKEMSEGNIQWRARAVDTKWRTPEAVLTKQANMMTRLGFKKISAGEWALRPLKSADGYEMDGIDTDFGPVSVQKLYEQGPLDSLNDDINPIVIDGDFHEGAAGQDRQLPILEQAWALAVAKRIDEWKANHNPAAVFSFVKDDGSIKEML
ncbi:hypothetical protein [Burkholderia singularis]|nr:hypothetical protein [Burkholderia singularis]